MKMNTLIKLFLVIIVLFVIGFVLIKSRIISKKHASTPKIFPKSLEQLVLMPKKKLSGFKIVENSDLEEDFQLKSNPGEIFSEYILKRMGAQKGYAALYDVYDTGNMAFLSLKISSIKKLIQFLGYGGLYEYCAIYGGADDIYVFISWPHNKHFSSKQKKKIIASLEKYRKEIGLQTVWRHPFITYKEKKYSRREQGLEQFIFRSGEIPSDFKLVLYEDFLGRYDLNKGSYGEMLSHYRLKEIGAQKGYGATYGKDGICKMAILSFQLPVIKGDEHPSLELPDGDIEEYIAIYQGPDKYVFIWFDSERKMTEKERADIKDALERYTHRLDLKTLWYNPLFIHRSKDESPIKVAKFKPTILSPDHACLGESLTVTINDEEAQFSPEETISVDFGPLIEVNSYSVESVNQITAHITIRDSGPERTTTVEVTTGDETKYYQGFTIFFKSVPPLIESIEPDPGIPGRFITIHGKYFHTDSSFSNHVYFNNQSAVVSEATSTKIVASIPTEFKGGIVTVVAGDRASDSVDYTVVEEAGRKDASIRFGQTVKGEILTRGIEDRFIFKAKEGTIVTIALNRLANSENGDSSLNPSLSLEDPEGDVIASDDDSGTDMPRGPGKNALIKNLVLPKTGNYTIVVYGTEGDINNGRIGMDLNDFFTIGPYRLQLMKE
ncbi:MAG: IPT/TIG domain-containing protein [bacterium]